MVLRLNVAILCIILMIPYNQIMPWDLNGLVGSSGTDTDLAQKCWVCPKLSPNKLIVDFTKGVSRAVQIERNGGKLDHHMAPGRIHMPKELMRQWSISCSP